MGGSLGTPASGARTNCAKHYAVEDSQAAGSAGASGTRDLDFEQTEAIAPGCFTGLGRRVRGFFAEMTACVRRSFTKNDEKVSVPAYVSSGRSLADEVEPCDGGGSTIEHDDAAPDDGKLSAAIMDGLLDMLELGDEEETQESRSEGSCSDEETDSLPLRDRYACNYALTVVDARTSADLTCLARGDGVPATMLARAYGDRAKEIADALVDKALAEMKPGTPVVAAVSAKLYDPERTPFGVLSAGKGSLKRSDRNRRDDIRRAIVANTLNFADSCMEFLFGDPDDEASIALVAGLVPQEVCDHLAVQWKAIDSLHRSKQVKAELKLRIARNALALRSIVPHLNAARDRPADSPEEAATLQQLAKVVQSLVNGHGVGKGKDVYEGFAKLGGGSQAADLENRWNRGFAGYARAVVGRADERLVDEAAGRGGKSLARCQKELKKLRQAS